jgi:6-phosphofructokinase
MSGFSLIALPRVLAAAIEFFSTKVGQFLLLAAMGAGAIWYAHHSGYSDGAAAGAKKQKQLCDSTIASMIATQKSQNDKLRREYELIIASNELAREQADAEAAQIAKESENQATALAEYTRFRMSQPDASACKLTKDDINFITKE